MKIWNVAQFDKELAKDMAKEYNIPSIVAILLLVRGFSDYDEISEFLSDDAEISDPFLMQDMDKAVKRIQDAISSFDKICIYGDYDADGITSTSILYSYLSSCEANVMYYIPSREAEGYGINKNAINQLHEQDVKLIITVDCGVSSVEEVELANSLGIDVVITDHHTPHEQLPNAVAVVNPHRKDCLSPFKGLAGVGVTFKLIMALEDEFLDLDELLYKYSDLVAVGTIGDVVPLVGENRVFVKFGLSVIKNAQRTGIKAILEQLNMLDKKINAIKLSFSLVPRINASGRMNLCNKCVDLLTTDDTELAKDLAQQIEEDNKNRQETERQTLTKVIETIKNNEDLKNQRIIVVDGEDFHAGIIGIIASRIKEVFQKPTIIISNNGEVSKGSGRSVKGFSICDAVFYCGELLLKYGGHEQAVGFSLQRENIDKFRVMINEYAKKIDDENNMPYPTLKIDCKLNPKMLNTNLINNMMLLEPFGAKNAVPMIGLFNMFLKQITPISDGKHLRLTFSRNDCNVTAMLFSCTLENFPFEIGDEIDLAVNLDTNLFKGREYLNVIIKQMKFSSVDYKELLDSKKVFEKFLRDENLTENEKSCILPVREDFAVVYKYLRSKGGYNNLPEVLHFRLKNKNISYGKLLVIIKAMSQLDLIDCVVDNNFYNISLKQTTNKIDLNEATIIKKLM